MTSYIFYHPWDSDFRITEKMLEWAKKNCPSYITNDAKDGFYKFYFGQEKDFVWFTLKWAAV